MSEERQLPCRLRVPGRGVVDVRVQYVLEVRNRETGAVVHSMVRPEGHETFEFPGSIGQGEITSRRSTNPDGEVFVVNVDARISRSWVLYGATLRISTGREGWRLILPTGQGRELPEIPEDLEFVGNYPGWSGLAQLMVLQSACGGIGFRAVDKHLEIKEFHARVDSLGRVVLEITRVPCEVSTDHWRVEPSCRIDLVVHEGTWVNAAKAYRQSQESVRPELCSPRPLPEVLQADPIWLTQNCFVYAPHSARETVSAAKQLAKPVCCHLYNWQDGPFDTNYPDWVGFAATTPSQMADLSKAGIPVTPYINCRIWDTSTSSWDTDGHEATVENVRGGFVEETYPTTDHRFAVACPSAAGFRDKLLHIARNLLDSGMGFSGLYLDQLGAAFSERCYRRGHNHPPGGSRSWVRGQRQLVGEMRELLEQRIADGGILTTENACEPLVDLVDGFLFYCGKRDDPLGRPIPLWQAIYGDICHNFAEHFDDDLEVEGGLVSLGMRQRIARQCIFGNAMGWLSPRYLVGEFEANRRLILRARQARRPLLKIIRSGTLVSQYLVSDGPEGTVFVSAWRYDGEFHGLAVNPGYAPSEIRWPDGEVGIVEGLDAVSRTLSQA